MRWKRLGGVVTLVGFVLLGAAIALSALPTARFPGSLWTYSEPAGLVRKSHFNAVAVEVEAIQQALGPNLSKVPPTRSHCAVVSLPVTGETVSAIWQAPYSLSVKQIGCKTLGGTLAEADLAVGAALVHGSYLPCSPTGTLVTPPAGATTIAKDAWLDLRVGSVVDAPTQLSVCFYTFPVG